MKENNTVDLYWAPVFDVVPNGSDWNMLYPEPQTLMSELMQERSDNMGTNGHFFTCPASSGYFKNTYVFHNSLELRVKYDFTDVNNPNITDLSNNAMVVNTLRPPTLKGKPMLNVNLGFVFFSEESLNVTFTPPFLTEPKFTKYGTPAPGTFDVSQWFRPYVFELQMWKPKGELIIEEYEPIFYVTGETNKQVNLKRFELNQKLYQYMNECTTAPHWQGRGWPLQKRYETFKRSRMNEIVLSEIKKNILS